MRLTGNSDSAGDLLTITQMCQAANLGEQTVRRIAQEAGAVRKIGKSYRIRKEVFLKYIDSEYSQAPAT